MFLQKLASYTPFSRPRVRKTATMLQMEATECGPASLRIVMNHHKIHCSLETLREMCGVSRDGTNAKNLVDVARQFGLRGKAINIDIPKINKRVVFPAIIFWNFNHFLVLEGYDEKRGLFYLNDPAAGRRVAKFDEFDTSFTGIVINFTRTEDYKPSGTRPQSYNRFYPLIKKSLPSISFIMLATLLLAVPGITIPVFSQIFIDDVLLTGDQQVMDWLLVGMVAILLMQIILVFLQKTTLALLGIKLSVVNSLGFIDHVLRLPVMFFSQRYIGDIANRIGLNERIALSLSNNIAINIINLLTSIIYGAVLLFYDLQLGAAAIAVMALNFVVLSAIRGRQNNANQVMYKEKATLLGVSTNGLNMIETIKSSGMELAFFRKWAGYQSKMLNAKQKLAVYSYILSLTPIFLNAFALVVVFYLGSFKVLDGVMSVGALIAFQGLMNIFLQPISNLVGFATELQLLKGDIERTDDVLNYAKDPLIQSDNRGKYKNLPGKIDIQDLTFAYAKFDKPVFEKLNLTIEPGSMVAIVGGSGSGKSTLVKLISRLYYAKEGTITIDGQSLRDIDRFLFAQSVSVVSQGINLFQGSIRDNLTFWDSSVDHEDICNALKDADIFDMVNQLPDGYDYQIKENGSNFSGGQRQCLEIARALVSNPSVLVLDEGTSALDSIKEAKIINNLKRRGCTCIFVAHRLGAIRDAHNIVVLDQGQIVQSGTHNQLILEDKLYKTLVTSQ